MTVEAKAESHVPESHAFEADVARLLHLMVHAVYSEKDVFLRELVSNAADACVFHGVDDPCEAQPT